MTSSKSSTETILGVLVNQKWKKVLAMPAQALQLRDDYLDMLIIGTQDSVRISSNPHDSDESLFKLAADYCDLANWWTPDNPNVKWASVNLTKEILYLIGTTPRLTVIESHGALTEVNFAGEKGSVCILPSLELPFGIKLVMNKKLNELINEGLNHSG